MLHVHIGPSPLALGLLVPCSRAAGFWICVIGRPGDESSNLYGFVGTGPNDLLSYPKVDAFEGPTGYFDLSQGVREQIESEQPLLLTCTLREMITERQPLVEAVLRARPRGAETIFLPCENAPHSAYSRLTEVCAETGATALRTVVNRMCTEGETDSDNRRMVSAHPLGEWLIERPPRPSQILDRLEATVPEVMRVDDYEARQARKLWMVNGAHQALALMAWEGTERTLGAIEGTDQMRRSDDLRTAARSLRVSSRLSHLHAAMDDALTHAYPTLEDNLEYGLKHVIAYSEHPDSVKRVLGAFRRQNLAPFIKTMDIRLASPARICASLDRSVAPFAFVFDVFEYLALSLDAFLDVAEIREDGVLIDPVADETALEVYARLVDGWTTDSEAKERVRRLASALASHR